MPPTVVGDFDFKGLGPLLAVAFLAPIGVGIFVDTWIHTFPAFMLIGVFGGIFADLVVFLVHAKDFYD